MFFYEYRRFHFIPFPYSIFSPTSLNQAFSFLKARTDERVTRASIRCRISRVPREIWLHHFYCPFPWHTLLRCPYFPFIFIFPRLPCGDCHDCRISDVSRELIPGQQRFHFLVMGLQYRLHHSDALYTLIFNLFIQSTYLFLIFKSAVCSSELTAPNFMIIYQSS